MFFFIIIFVNCNPIRRDDAWDFFLKGLGLLDKIVDIWGIMYAIVRYKIDDYDTAPDLDVLFVTMDENEAIEQLSQTVYVEFGYSTEMEELADGKYNWELPADRDDFVAYYIQICEI